jgi:hypothetical protein
MAEVNTFRCDGPGCDKVKGDSNHWFRIRMTPSEFHLRAWDAEPIAYLMGVAELHACSEGCATKLLSNAIGAKTPR